MLRAVPRPPERPASRRGNYAVRYTLRGGGGTFGRGWLCGTSADSTATAAAAAAAAQESLAPRAVQRVCVAVSTAAVRGCVSQSDSRQIERAVHYPPRSVGAPTPRGHPCTGVGWAGGATYTP
jgi:hypothetical protein